MKRLLALESVQASLNRTEGGRWFIKHWPILSLATDLATIGTDVLVNLSRNKAVIRQALAENGQTQAVESFDELMQEAETVVVARVDKQPHQQPISKLVEASDGSRNARGNGKPVTLASRLNGSLKTTYNALVKAGLQTVEDGSTIKFLGANGEELATIANDKFTPKKWKAQWKGEELVETSEGYKLIAKDGDFGFDLGFKEGRKLTADEINEYFKLGRGANEPYMPGTQVIERLLQPKQKIYVVEYRNQDLPGGWGSKDRISTVSELREELAVLKSWKNEAEDVLVIREYEIIKPVKVRDGQVGPQLEISGPNAGKTYPGGGHQYEFLEGRWDDVKNSPYVFMKKTNENILKQ